MKILIIQYLLIISYLALTVLELRAIIVNYLNACE
jgi:hypothetical protein